MAFRGTNETYAGTAGPSASTQAGDIMVAVAMGQTPLDSAGPGGWTQIGAEQAIGPVDFRYYATAWLRVAQSGDSSSTWVWTDAAAVIISSYSGRDGSSPLESFDMSHVGLPEVAEPTSATIPSLTTASSNADAVLIFIGIRHEKYIYPGAWTDRYVGNADASGSADRTGLASGVNITGTVNFTEADGVTPVNGSTAMFAAILRSQPTPPGVQPVAAGAMVSTNTSGATLTPALPAGWAADDLHLLFTFGRVASDVDFTTIPAGWTKRAEIYRSANTLRAAVYTRFAVAGDTAPVLTPGSSYAAGGTTRGASAFIVGMRGVDPAILDAAIATLSNAAQTDLTPTSVTTATAGAVVLACGFTADDNNLGLLSGSQQGFQVIASGTAYHTTNGDDRASIVAYLKKDTAGAVTMCTLHQNAVASDAWVSMTIALRPFFWPTPRPLIVGAAVGRATSW